MDCRQLSLALLSPANSLSPLFRVALFKEVGGRVDVGAGAEDVSDGELAAEAVVGEGDVGGVVGVVNGHELAEGIG